MMAEEPSVERINVDIKDLYERREKSTAILVTGIPRSGTSMVGGILHHLGVYMGKYHTDADDLNAEGYFEDLRFANYHAALTGTYNFDQMIWYVQKIVNENVAVSMFSSEFSGGIYVYFASIAANCIKHEKWGVKDPRIVFPFIIRDFISLCNDIVNVKVIYVARTFASSAKSLLNISNYDKGDVSLENLQLGLEIVAHQFVSGLRWMEIPHIVVRYEDILSNTRHSVNKIADFCDVEPTDEAVNFVNPELRRY